MERDAKRLAALETLDNGKPVEDSLVEIQASADLLRYYAGYCDKIYGNTIPAGIYLIACSTVSENIFKE